MSTKWGFIYKKKIQNLLAYSFGRAKVLGKFPREEILS